MAERNFYDDIMGFFGQDAQSVISGRKEDPVTGRVKANLGDFFAGRSQAELDSAYDQMKTTQRRKKGKTAFEESGYTAAELGIDPDKTSVGAVNSAIRNIRETKADEKSDLAFTRSMKPLEMQMAQQNANANRSHQLSLLQMADTKEARATELEYQKSRDRKEDMRYNERMEQLDRKDRRQAMQSLAAGLASLGAAFAL